MEYSNLAPVIIAALTACAVESGYDADLGLPTFVEYETSENATDSWDGCLTWDFGLLGGDFGACLGDAGARLGELGGRVGDREMRGGDERPFGLCLSFNEGRECRESAEWFEGSAFGAGVVCTEFEMTT